MRTHFRTVAALILLSFPGCALAQRPGGSDLRTRCRLAIQIVRTGQPAPHTLWAYEIVPDCGSDGGAAVAASMRARRTSSDTTELDIITRPSSRIVDGEIFRAAMQIAGDPQASGPARAFAFRTLVYQGYPGAVSTYAQITLQTTNVECIGGGSGFDFEAREGSPLPADAFQQVVALTDRVRSEAGLPPRVARAAVCAWQASLRKLPR